MNLKLISAFTVSISSYMALLYVIFVTYPYVGKMLLPSLIVCHVMSLIMAWNVYKQERFEVPVIGDFIKVWIVKK